MSLAHHTAATALLSHSKLPYSNTGLAELLKCIIVVFVVVFVYLFICLFVCSFVCLFVCLSLCLPVLFVVIPAYESLCLSVCLSPSSHHLHFYCWIDLDDGAPMTRLKCCTLALSPRRRCPSLCYNYRQLKLCRELST